MVSNTPVPLYILISITSIEADFEKIKYENSKLLSENKVIQKDHAELMHTVHQLSSIDDCYLVLKGFV